jgi:Fe-Mn family superoxide dismutase
MELSELILTENRTPIKQVPLKYSRTSYSPVLTGATIDLHYGKLYKGYVDRYNDGSGDPVFCDAGAYLHGLYFSQFRPLISGPALKPRGPILDLIHRHFKDFDEFKQCMKDYALTLRGSYWVYLNKNGVIKHIYQHQKRSDIVILIDLWEHAYVNQYGSNKSKYMDQIWRIMDWSVINKRVS